MDLSPGTFHLDVPTDPEENLDWREWVLTEARRSPALQAGLLEACRRDFFFWIDTFVWQINPRKFGDEVGPFVLFDFQRRVLKRTLHRLFVVGQAMIWEKSRYQGATWLLILIDVWLALFHDWKKFYLVSHSEDAVFKGDDDSLLKKLEFVHQYLPDWMLRGADRKVKAKTLTVSYPATHSSVAGGANTAQVGVGTRFAMLGCDEFAKQPNAVEILSNTADTGARLFVSTHYGVGTSFYAMCAAEGAVKEVMHWSENPMQNAGLYRSDPGIPDAERPLDKSYVYPPDFDFVRDGRPHGGPCPGLRSPWYDTEVVERLRLGSTERDVAMHLDIDAQGSTFQYFSPPVIRALQRKCERWPSRRYDVVVDPMENAIVSLDPLEAGLLWLWCDLDHAGKPPPDDYAIGIDPAAGNGATPTCMSIVNGLGEKVGAYVNPFAEPHEYAPVAVGLAKLFYTAILVWEVPGPGAKLCDKVLEARYPRIYWRPKNPAARVKEASQRPGWWNQRDTATLLLRNYKEALVKGRFVNRCPIALGQCLDYVFVDNNIEHTGRKDAKGDPSGARDNHGDRVIADALALLGIVTAGKLRDYPVGEEPVKVASHPGSLAGRRLLAAAAEAAARPVASWFAKVRAG